LLWISKTALQWAVFEFLTDIDKYKFIEYCVLNGGGSGGALLKV
jgi:hypothetical protein